MHWCTCVHTLRIVLPDKILRLMTSLIIIILLSKTMCVSHTQQYFCSFVLLTFCQVLCTVKKIEVFYKFVFSVSVHLVCLILR